MNSAADVVTDVIAEKTKIIGMLEGYPYLIALFFLTIIIVVYLIVAWKQPRILNIFTFIFSKLKTRCTDIKCVKEDLLINIKEMLEQDKLDREKRQEEQDKRFDAYDKILEETQVNIKALFSLVADNEAISKDASRGTLENMLCNEVISPLRRLKAFYKLIALGVNGIIKEIGFKVILEHKKLWQEVLVMKLDVKIVNQEFFDRTMNEIRQNIYGGVM
jgi:hypothetical protein